MQLPWTRPEVPTPLSHSSQRSAMRNRLSAFFHGSSVVADESPSERQQSCRMFRNKQSHFTHSSNLEMSSLNRNTPAPRSPSSTRSLIDPTSSPANSARPFSNATYEQFSGNPFSPASAHLAGSPRTMPYSEPMVRHHTSRRHRRNPRWRTKNSSGRVYFRNKSMHQTVFKCIISGGLLAATLIVCT